MVALEDGFASMHITSRLEVRLGGTYKYLLCGTLLRPTAMRLSQTPK